MGGDRHSKTELAELIENPDERARRETENGIRQFDLAMEFVRTHVRDQERPFRLKPSILLQLHKTCLDGIHLLAGTYRNGPAKIQGSYHTPPDAHLVADLMQEMCEYVNDNWNKTGIHLASYVLWRLNWIHPFADGNGRTSRIASYIVLCVKLDSILPGITTIPDQIASDKKPYYDALEEADRAWQENERIDVSALESLLDALLARQLLDAVQEASAGSN